MLQDEFITPAYASSFSATFIDGYSFRHLFDYLKNFNNNCSIILSNNRIRIEQSDYKSTIYNVVTINTNNLLEYKLAPADNIDEIIFQVNISDIISMIKIVGKKDSVKLYKNSMSNKLRIKIANQANFNSAFDESCSIKIQDSAEQYVYELPNYSKPETNPTAKAQTARFVKLCKSLSQVKCNNISIKLYPNGIRFEAKTDGELTSLVEDIGQCGDMVVVANNYSTKLVNKVNQKELATLYVRNSVIKNLNKLGNLISSHSSLVYFYVEEGYPLKILSRVGLYGKIRIYITSDNNE